MRHYFNESTTIDQSFLLAVLSLGALIIIGYEIKQNYKATKKISNPVIEDSPEATPNMEYNLIEDNRREGDELGIQHL
jgi:hypothetical protein